MKGIKSNKVFSFAIIIAAMIISGRNNLFSQCDTLFSCPIGYVCIERHIPVTINGNTCMYTVGLCVSCPAGTHPLPFIIMLKAFRADTSICQFDPSAAVNAIMEIIADPNWIEANISHDCFAGWGPCPWNAVEVTGVTPLCWQKTKYLDDDNQIRIIYSGCYEEGCTCKRKKTICWEGGHFIIIDEPFHRVPEGCISPCENIQEPSNDSFPDPTEEEPFPMSICFELQDACN